MLDTFADMLVATNNNAQLSTSNIAFGVAVGVLSIVSCWILFTKAGEKGWKVLIPIYNWIVFFKIAGLEPWKILLYLIPFVNIYIDIKFNIELAHRFGKSTGFGVLSFFFGPICYAIMAFGDAEYKKPAAAKN